jgi:hypothetical protein
MPGASASTHGLACDEKEHTRKVATGESRYTGIPCAMVLTVSFVLFPGTGLSCPRHRRKLRRLDISVGISEPHDFAVRIDIARLATPTHPSHPALNVRDDAQRPSDRGGMRGNNHRSVPDGKRNISHAGTGPPKSA